MKKRLLSNYSRASKPKLLAGKETDCKYTKAVKNILKKVASISWSRLLKQVRTKLPDALDQKIRAILERLISIGLLAERKINKSTIYVPMAILAQG